MTLSHLVKINNYQSRDHKGDGDMRGTLSILPSQHHKEAIRRLSYEGTHVLFNINKSTEEGICLRLAFWGKSQLIINFLFSLLSSASSPLLFSSPFPSLSFFLFSFLLLSHTHTHTKFSECILFHLSWPLFFPPHLTSQIYLPLRGSRLNINMLSYAWPLNCLYKIMSSLHKRFLALKYTLLFPSSNR